MNAIDRSIVASTPLQPKITVENVDIRFPSPGGEIIDILRDVSFDVPAGQFVSVVGPSGCGKSTLLRILSGLIEPAGGRALIDGRAIKENKERIGFMFQSDTLLPWASVEENIRVGGDLAGVPGNATAERVRELVAFLRLAGFEKHRPHELSGGMRQRVALGRLLAFEPHIYLLDEPFGALDSQTKSAMGHELLNVWARHRRSVLFVTHDIEEAVTLSDRVIVLSSRPGKIKLDISIDLPRPRIPAELRRNREFLEFVDTIWNALDIVRD